MPIRRGRFAPQNTFLETIAQKFDRGNSNFVLGSAQEKNDYPIVYCSDGFCEITGFSRSELMRRSCTCGFLYGIETNQDDVENIRKSFKAQLELKKEILFYKKNGSPFWCLLDIVPIKNEKGHVVLFLASHKDITKRKISGEIPNRDLGPGDSDQVGKSGLTRSRSRKFSRDVLFHLSRQYQQTNGTSSRPKQSSKKPFKRARSFSFNKERLPQYKRETTKRSKFLFLHYSHIKGLWDWWVLILTFYIAIMVPYNVAFQRHDRVRDLIIFDMVIELFFILDIVVHFRTTYVDSAGRVIYDQKAIAFRYLKGWFILDFLAALPFEALYFINQSWGFLVQLLKCGRLLRLFRVVRKLQRYTEYSAILLTLLMMAFAMVAHWLACVWYVIGYEEVKSKSTISWLFELGEKIHQPYANFTLMSGPDDSSAYVTALYFTLSSMTTVGFGNVSANTNGEKIFSVIVMLIGAVMHAAIFGNVAAIIQKLYASRVRYHSRSNEIKQFIRVHRIEQELSNRLEDYFHTNWSISGGVDTREILNMFPTELQADVCMHLYRSLLEIPTFAQAPRGCLRALSLQIRPVYIGPGDHILMQNDVVNAIYYLQAGSMEVLQGDSVAAILGKGDLFGEDISRKTPIRRSNGDVRALTYCDVLYITRDRFQDVLQLYSDFGFKFAEKLELTYDLGASERDIWRLGLDAISEDEEEEDDVEETIDSARDENTTKDVVFFGYRKNIGGVPPFKTTNNHLSKESSLKGYLKTANERRNRLTRSDRSKSHELKPLLRDECSPTTLEELTATEFLPVSRDSSFQSGQEIKSPDDESCGQTSSPSLEWDHASLGIKPKNGDGLSTLNEESDASAQSSPEHIGNVTGNTSGISTFGGLEGKLTSSQGYQVIDSAASTPRGSTSGLLGMDDGNMANYPIRNSFIRQRSVTSDSNSSPVLSANEFGEDPLTSIKMDFSSLPLHKSYVSPYSFSLSSNEMHGRTRSDTNESYISYPCSDKQDRSSTCRIIDDTALSSTNHYTSNQANTGIPSHVSSHDHDFLRTNDSNSSLNILQGRERSNTNTNSSISGSPLPSIRSFGRSRCNTNSSCSPDTRRRKTGSPYNSPASSFRRNGDFSTHLFLSCNDSDRDESVGDGFSDQISQHTISSGTELTSACSTNETLKGNHHEDNIENGFLSSNESTHSKKSTSRGKDSIGRKQMQRGYSEMSPHSTECPINPHGRRKLSAVVVPPVFAQLVLNVNNPYLDFVPPVRESPITCSCVETESCETCRGNTRDSHSDGESAASNENRQEASKTGSDYITSNHLNWNHNCSGKESGNSDSEWKENEKLDYSTVLQTTKHNDEKAVGAFHYPDYIRNKANDETNLNEYRDDADNKTEDLNNDTIKTSFVNGYSNMPSSVKENTLTSSFSSVSSDPSHSQEWRPESSELKNCTRNSSLPDLVDDEPFQPYDLPFPHESFSKASLSSNLSNHRSETKINFAEMEQEIPSRTLRSSFSAPALNFGCLATFDEREEDKIIETDGELTLNDAQLEKMFEDVASTKECVAKLKDILGSTDSIPASERLDTNEIVRKLEKQVLFLNQEVIFLSFDMKKVLDLLNGLKNSQ